MRVLLAASIFLSGVCFSAPSASASAYASRAATVGASVVVGAAVGAAAMAVRSFLVEEEPKPRTLRELSSYDLERVMRSDLEFMWRVANDPKLKESMAADYSKVLARDAEVKAMMEPVPYFIYVRSIDIQMREQHAKDLEYQNEGFLMYPKIDIEAFKEMYTGLYDPKYDERTLMLLAEAIGEVKPLTEDMSYYDVINFTPLWTMYSLKSHKAIDLREISKKLHKPSSADEFNFAVENAAWIAYKKRVGLEKYKKEKEAYERLQKERVIWRVPPP